MKSISTQLSFFLQDKQMQRNVRTLLKYLAFLAGVVALFTVLFHVIMLHAEGERYSWITGLYWTLTVMSTLGFGDITFHTDVGRLFSVIVLMSGIVLLLIVLPFAFIRFFYAPWLESRIRQRAPKALPPDTSGHVIFCTRDPIADDLRTRFAREDIPYVILEADPATASTWHDEGLSMMTGRPDEKDTYTAARAGQARLVVANGNDMTNVISTLTLREAAPDASLAAVASDEDAVDILQLSGATRVLPLKKRLGEQLANRTHARRADLLTIGEYEDLRLAELPAHDTSLAGKTIRETGLRERTGVNVIAVWERGTLQTARPGTVLTSSSVPVVAGTQEQLAQLHDLTTSENHDPRPVLVVGGGRVGRAAMRALRRRDVPVHLVEKNPERCRQLRNRCTKVFQGDAADYDLLEKAGIAEAASVLLTTNEDAANIYLASYCRRLNEDLRVVSRITYRRNLSAIHRAGADFVLSYASLGAEVLMSIIQDKELVVMGEGADLIARALPESLHGKTLAESEIGAQTGLNVVALSRNGEVTTGLKADTPLPPDAKLLMVGNDAQLADFIDHFE